MPLDHRCCSHRHRATAALHGEFLLGVPGLLPPLQGLYAGMDRHGGLQGPHRASATLARRPRLQEQERRRDRLRRDGRDADSGHRERLRARHDAAALADVFPNRPQRHRDRRGAAQAADRRSVDSRGRPPQDHLRTDHLHAALVHSARESEEGIAWRGQRDPRPRLRHGYALHAELTGRGGSASRSCRMATCFTASSRARPPW